MNPTEPRLGQLAHKVRELDPGSRALLDLSVRRGLGDVEIAGVLGTDPNYIANTRTGVMQSIAADLRLDDRERAELESTLAQLPPEAWLPPAAAESAPNGAGNGVTQVSAVPAPAEADAEEAPEAEAEQPEPETTEDDVEEPEAEEAAAEGDGEAAPEAEVAEPEVEERETAEPEAEEPETPAAEAEPEPEQPEAAEPEAPAVEDDGGRAGAATLVGSGRRSRRTGAIVTSIALVLLAAVLVIALASSGDDDDPADEPAAPAERENPAAQGGTQPRGQELQALGGAGGATGTARLDGQRLVLRVSGLPGAAAGYQVWLYDSLIEAKRLGRLRAGDGQTFEGRFPAREIGRYGYVDISVEPRDGNSNHSGRSVMRIATDDLR